VRGGREGGGKLGKGVTSNVGERSTAKRRGELESSVLCLCD